MPRSVRGRNKVFPPHDYGRLFINAGKGMGRGGEVNEEFCIFDHRTLKYEKDNYPFLA